MAPVFSVGPSLTFQVRSLLAEVATKPPEVGNVPPAVRQRLLLPETDRRGPLQSGVKTEAINPRLSLSGEKLELVVVDPMQPEQEGEGSPGDKQ
ncbi:UNVERIFIED_CONTAM: hypothetical protein K2H54_064138, partial [Gekko kuhli]